MLGSSEHDAFIARSVTAIVTTIRADGSSASSMVAFARRDDRLFFTTGLQRAKARMLQRDARATVVVLNQHEPWSFVSIEGDVIIHRDNPSELRQLILDAVDHPDYVWSREFTETAITADGRAMFELVPRRVSGVVAPRESQSADG
jgi:PPOX class probable F420-dependent enzyme